VVYGNVISFVDIVNLIYLTILVEVIHQQPPKYMWNLRSGHVEALPIEQWLCQSVFQKTNYCLYPVLCKYLITQVHGNVISFVDIVNLIYLTILVEVIHQQPPKYMWFLAAYQQG
jgi:hypothetical protein